jgi:hypothetical protein
MKKQKFRKTQLSLALTSVLAATGAVQAHDELTPTLDNNDRLGDAGIFQYYTVNNNWQTFFRIINTSNKPIAVQVRFHEAANSREALDFIVFLSAQDMWSAWTDANALSLVGGTGPGIRTKDQSCTYPGVDTNVDKQGWVSLDSESLKGAAFSSAAFTDKYDDGGNTDKPPAVRLAEGYMEVIGIASYDALSPIGQAIEGHNCSLVETDWENYRESRGRGGDDYGDHDVHNVLAFNGGMINVRNGQGAGYDPDVIRDFQDSSLMREALETSTKPDLDSASASSFGRHAGPYYKVAINQRLADDTTVPVKIQYAVDINGNGQYGNTVWFDVNHSGTCGDDEDVNEKNIDEDNAPPEAAGVNMTVLNQGGTPCYTVASPATPVVTQHINPKYANQNPGQPAADPWFPKQTDYKVYADYENPARIAQNGWAPDEPVRGGVDAISWLLMRDAVINEWAASPTPTGVVKDYFTQWVVTFPTKHFYVDMQDDPIPKTDDISPTLADVDTDGEAFAPFTQKFQDSGMSCDPFGMDLWNREEAHKYFASPVPGYPAELCYEANVITFDQAYEGAGLASGFNVTVPHSLMPPAGTGGEPWRGWARMGFVENDNGGAISDTFYGAETGLFSESWEHGDRLLATYDNRKDEYVVRKGLPVTGFMFNFYNTGNVLTNHAGINAHKYTRDEHGFKPPQDLPEKDG